mgnify:CR=1 FL=1
MARKFSYNSEGFEEAKKYLKSVNHWTSKLSTSDGFSIVSIANTHYSDHNDCDKCAVGSKCKCKNG